MKKYLTLLLLTLALSFGARAQYVTLPDTAFANWLQGHGFAACMVGNQLDTTCPTVMDTTGMECYHIHITDLTGIQYFKSLQYLDCSYDSLLLPPVLPASLRTFNCQQNPVLGTLPTLPDSLATLTCGNTGITQLPALPALLTALDVSANNLGQLPALPPALQNLICSSCGLSALPQLPVTIIYLDCGNNPLFTLPALWPGLQQLTCSFNSLTSLPALPSSLQLLVADNNQLTSLPALPDSMYEITLSGNQLTSLPALPHFLLAIDCSSNPLTSIPALPPYIQYLYCSNDSLSILPAFPPTMLQVVCTFNKLTSIPAIAPVPLDTSMWSIGNNGQNWFYLDCSYNNITSLPTLPDSMYALIVNNNHNLTCLPQLGFVYFVLSFDSTAITCLPNYGTIDSSSPALNTVPLCGPGNQSPCGVYWDIAGAVFYDANNNCTYDAPDSGISQVKLMLYNNGVLQQQTYTGAAGLYSFNAANNNTYNIVVDTSNIPFAFNSTCPDTGSLPVTLNTADSAIQNNNFAFVCNPTGFDLGVQSIWYNYHIIARPATVIPMYNIAGDLTALYGAHCATGIGGTVQVIYNGQASYIGPQPGALTPDNVSGDTLTYNIADFGQVNPLTAFNIYLQLTSNVDATGSQVCVTVNVAANTGGDYNTNNNTLSYCLTIVNALDPNEKEVYPSHAVGGGQWLTYTIRFQNCGTAPAQNIVVKDTLNSNLDISTFTLLNASAKNTTQLLGNVAVFTLQNINLVDSLVSDSASRGYVQFKIKTKSTVTAADELANTGYVYFDLNPAVVTNTALVNGPTGITTPTAQSSITVSAYPNPFNDITNIEITGLTGAAKYNFEMYDVTGRLQLSIPSSAANHFQINRGKLAAGIYTYRLAVGEDKATAFGKLVIQ